VIECYITIVNHNSKSYRLQECVRMENISTLGGSRGGERVLGLAYNVMKNNCRPAGLQGSAKCLSGRLVPGIEVRGGL
jgi:hypothetical protein